MAAAHTLKEQLAQINLLESEIARKRIDESLSRIMRENDNALDIRQATHQGGQ